MKKETEIMNFCKNIKQLRIINKLSKKEMAKQIGIGTKSLTLIENGELPKKLGCNVLFKIHKNFGIAPKEMFANAIQQKNNPSVT